LKTRKKRKFKKRYWLLVSLGITIVILILLLYKPARYDPSEAAPAAEGRRQVSPYLTHELSPQLYNGVQRDQPFDLIVTQDGINDIIAHSKWPRKSDGVRFSAPIVLFVPDGIVLMTAANMKGVEFVVTIVAEARLDDDGLLNLQIAKVKVGAMNITFVAKAVAKRMYHQQLATTPVDTEDFRVRVAASIFNDQPFEPAFKLEDKKVRIEKITITHGKLTIRLSPASD